MSNPPQVISIQSQPQQESTFNILGTPFSSTDIILYVAAFFFPPLPVFFLKGLFSLDLLLCVIFTMFGHIPGLIYAVLFIRHFRRTQTGLLEGYRQTTQQRQGYQQISDLEAQFQAGQNYDQPQVASPVPQHPPSNLNSFRDESPKQGSSTGGFNGTGERLGSTTQGSSDLPPAYDDIVVNGPRDVGDYKIQRP